MGSSQLPPSLDAGASIDDVVQVAQLQSHVKSVPYASLVSAFVALLCAGLLSGAAPHALLLGWLLVLAGVLGLRGAVWRATRRSTPTAASARQGLRRYRALALAHGMTWGTLAALVPQTGAAETQTLLALVLAGLAASAMTLTLFDLSAALLFSGPVLLSLALRLALAPTLALTPPVATAALAMAVVLLGFLVLAARRVQRERTELARARHAGSQGLQEALRSQALLHLIFDHAGEGISVFDASLQLVAWNDRFVQMTRLDPAAVRAGAPLRELLFSLARSGEFGPCNAAIEADRRVALLGRGPASVLRRVRPDGRTLEMRRSPTPGGGFVMIYVDVTEREAAAAALAEKTRMLTLLLEHTTQGFWFTDNELRSTDVNPALCQIVGRPREAILGHTIFEFVDDENAAVLRQQLQLRSRGLPGSYSLTLTRPDGTPVHCVNNATPLFDADGRRIGSIGILTDISAQRRAEQQLRQTGELLAQKSRVLEVTLESLSQGVLGVDAEGRTNAWNQRFLELLNVPESLMRCQPTLRELVRWQAERGHFGERFALLDDAVRSPVERMVIGDGNEVVHAYRRTTADGRVLDVQSHFAPDGSLVRTYTDVTESVNAQQALRESETRFRTMADAAPALIWQSGADGRPIWFNQRWLTFTGRTMDAELRTRWSERAHPEDYAGCHSDFEQALAARRRYDIEFRLRDAGGRWRWIAESGIPRFAADGRFGGYVSYGWEITERKAAEAALIAAKDEAERANHAKSEFLSRMSHELRTPMNAILGFGQLLESDAADPLSGAQRARVQEMLRGGRHLLALINEVLDLARIEAGALQLQLEPVDVEALVGDCLRLVQPMAAARAITLEAAPPTAPARLVLADPVRLKQVLLNLLSNAIKYNRDAGSVMLACSVDGDALRVEVRDSGPGLSPAQQARLFQAFERLDADKSGIEGTGIGLALSKWLVNLMHGEIGVASAPGEGSTFWVRLARCEPRPAAVAAAAGAADSPRPAPRPAPQPAPLHTVLYIEDNPVNQALMEGMLGQRPGIRLLMAEQPEAGLALAAQAQPDLVLLDIQLPGIDGWEVLRRLRAAPPTQRIPVVAVSANAMPGDLAEARAAGFAAYLTKPLDLPHLLATVDQMLGALAG